MTWTLGFCLQLRWATTPWYRIQQPPYTTLSVVKVRKHVYVLLQCDDDVLEAFVLREFSIMPAICLILQETKLHAPLSVHITFTETSVQETYDDADSQGGSPRPKRRRLFKGTVQSPSNSDPAAFQEMLAPFKVRRLLSLFLPPLFSRSPQACILLLDRLVQHRWRLLHSFRVLSSLSFILDGSQVSAMDSSLRFLQLPRIIQPHFAVFYLCITCSDLFLYIYLSLQSDAVDCLLPESDEPENSISIPSIWYKGDDNILLLHR